MVMEKPAEMLLTNTDIRMRFCFSWASVQWVRSWSKLVKGSVGGSIASKFEKQDHEGNGILLEQDFGREETWKQHFDYLLPFFRDDRHIKVDGKPMFLFHNANEIDCLQEMTDYWRQLAEEAELPGLYLVGTTGNPNLNFPMLDAMNLQQPQSVFYDFIRYSDESKQNICLRYNDYDEVCEWERYKVIPEDKKIYLGIFAGFDSTPRHGHKGRIIANATPENIKKAYRQACIDSIRRDNEFVFINAWNEWAEGNYLEPDEEFKYGKLESIKAVNDELLTLDESLIENKEVPEIFRTVIDNKQNELLKMKALFRTLNKLMVLMESDIDLVKSFKDNNWATILIVGNGVLSKHLMAMLNGEIQLAGIVDYQQGTTGGIFVDYDAEWPKADVVIVTNTLEFRQEKEKFTNKSDAIIVSMESLLDDLLL